MKSLGRPSVSANTVRNKLKQLDPSLVVAIEPNGRYANGGKKATYYQYEGPNADSVQLEITPQLKTLRTPNSTGEDAVPVKEIA